MSHHYAVTSTILSASVSSSSSKFIFSSSVLSPVSTYVVAFLCRPLVLRSPETCRSRSTLAFFATEALIGAVRFLAVGEGGDLGTLLWTFVLGFNGFGFGLRGA